MTNQPPKVGFLSPLYNLGDTLSLIEIARIFKRLGGEAIFIGYSGEYEGFIKDIDCRIIKIREKVTEKLIKEKEKRLYERLYWNRPLELEFRKSFSKEYEQYFIDKIGQIIEIIKKEEIKILVASYGYTALISAHASKIPLVRILSGVSIPLYYKSKRATFPDNFENFFTKLIPNSIKNYFANWFLLQCRWDINSFNQLARKYNLSPVKRLLDTLYADYTLVADDIDFLNLKPTSDFPKKNFVGPILFKQPFRQIEKMSDSDINDLLKKTNKKILLTLGSSGTKKTYFEILKSLNKTNFNVIAVHSGILNEDEKPHLRDNILLKRFVPSIKKINENVDLAIIHGGRGTVYTAAFSGKPVIGIPMHIEQQYNLDNLVRYGSAIRLSRKFSKEKHLLEAIEEIFDNYDSYFKKAQSLKKILTKQDGAENAARRILEIALKTK